MFPSSDPFLSPSYRTRKTVGLATFWTYYSHDDQPLYATVKQPGVPLRYIDPQEVPFIVNDDVADEDEDY